MSLRSRESFEAVAGPVSRETFEKLLTFEKEFGRWAARINLVAPSTLDDVWTRHILDSAQLAPLTVGVHTWLDLGSGGGFPGAIMAILLSERDHTRVDLVESAGKKVAFLRTVLAQLGVATTVHNERIESLYDRIETPEVISARALAPLNRLLHLAEPWLSNGSRGFFHKGRDYAGEVKESIHHWNFDLIEHASVVESGSVILEITNLNKR